MNPITWRQVPGWFNFDDVYLEAVEKAPASGAHFVEVGVLLGKSTLFMAETIRQSKKKIAFDAVDVMGMTPEAIEQSALKYRDLCPCENHSRLLEVLDVARQLGQLAAVEHVVRLSGLGEHVRVVKSSGQVWSCSYPFESLDLVYVDAMHTYDDTAGLLRAFLPKVRRGGTLAGHDYSDHYPELKAAVRDVLGTVRVQRESFVWTKP